MHVANGSLELSVHFCLCGRNTLRENAAEHQERGGEGNVRVRGSVGRGHLDLLEGLSFLLNKG